MKTYVEGTNEFINVCFYAQIRKLCILFGWGGKKKKGVSSGAVSLLKFFGCIVLEI